MKPLKKYKGTISVEVLTSVFLLILITAVLLTLLRFYAHYNHLQWARQRCTAAAQAQLDSVMMQKTALAPEEIQSLWPGVKCTLSKLPGTDTWKGLDLYTATSTAKVRNRMVSIQINRYIKSGELH